MRSVISHSVCSLVGIIILVVVTLSHQALGSDQNPSSSTTAEFARINYEELPSDVWKSVRVGQNNQSIQLAYGPSYYAALALPKISGTVELRTQMPVSFSITKTGLMPCVTFLDDNFRVTHSHDYHEAQPPSVGAFRPLEQSLVEMKVQKRAADRYLLVHTNKKIIGQKIRVDLGNRGSTIVVGRSFAYSAANPKEIFISPTAKGMVRVKFFPAADRIAPQPRRSGR